MQWTKWQGWIALVAGAYAALSPIWTETDTKATWTMVVLGAVTAVVGLWSMVRPADAISEYALVVLGALFIVSPWVMGFDQLDNMALTAWIVGAVTVIGGLLGVPQVEDRLHLHHGPIAH